MKDSVSDAKLKLPLVNRPVKLNESIKNTCAGSAKMVPKYVGNSRIRAGGNVVKSWKIDQKCREFIAIFSTYQSGCYAEFGSIEICRFRVSPIGSDG